ncbi:C25 family cysteine peptidase [Echinicola sp. 20G]|uniref:putative type IX secretion system sortase PorU2 n=1 Tax=Echinicola sp. 20G TaxID=2781961 RepID=UPI0019102897|nr:C25 family cysteine peptidase [Echinicola sp. 20G]
MKKLILLFLLVIAFLHPGKGQSEWINHALTYYKIPTSTDGIYHISYTTLSASGMNLNGVDPRTIRIYHRGQEVAIYIAGEQDGRFDQADYIQFIGERNDGSSDIKLYPDPDNMANPKYNNHSDATAFFLTVTPGTFGKRMGSRNVDPSIPETNEYTKKVSQVFADQYALGQTYSLGVRLGKYDVGQGWTGRAITRGNFEEVVFRELGTIASDFEASLEMGLVGRSDAPHRVEVYVGPNSDQLRLLQTENFLGFEYRAIQASLQASDVGTDGRFVVQAKPVSTEGSSDNVSISFATLTYKALKQEGEFASNKFKIEAGEQNITFGNMQAEYLAYEVSDVYNPLRLIAQKESGNLTISAGTAARESEILVQQRSAIIEPNVLERVKFRNLMNRSANYIILTHKSLRQATSVNTDPVAAYAGYRHSPAGGGYDTLIVTANELYNQFNYGEKSPLAVKEFLRQYSSKFAPEYLLLMGRAFGMYNSTNSGGVTYFYRDRPDLFSIQDLVPTYGYPYNDNLFAVGFDENDPMRKDIAIGRIPVRTPEQVNDYLNKIKEKEALGASAPWQKDMAHLSGGLSAFELERYYNFVKGFENIAENIYYGADVTTFRKRSNEPVELINISDKVNEGVSMITFFGHAATSTTDIDIGFVSQDELGYDNKGKYPFLLLNGCDAGNAFGTAYTFGEDWILTPDRGASNFLAHASIGVDVYLRRYSESFYTKSFADSSLIYRPIGKVKIEAEKYFYNRYGTSEINQSHVNQMVMLGDPAVRIFPAKEADYALSTEEVAFTDLNGENINSLTDTIDMAFVVRNLGRVNLDTIDFKVSRTLPDGTVIPFETEDLTPVFYRDTIHFSVPNVGIVAAGDNVFTITINTTREVPELTYANNTIVVNKFIESSGTQNLSPLNYAIEQRLEVEMIAQIPGKSTEDRTIVFQLDTSPDFSSAWRKESRVTTRNIAKWKQSIADKVNGTDSVTFYWRTRFLQQKEGESKEWARSSFTYIPNGPEGWIQRQFTQLGENHIQNMEIDQPAKQWKYQGTQLNLDVYTFGSQAEGLTYGQVQIQLDGSSYNQDLFQRRCTNGSFGLMAFDQRSLAPYLVVPLTNFDVLDGKSCGKTPQIIQNIRNSWITGDGQTMLLDYIDGLKEGDYVVIFSVGAVTFEDWPDEAFLKMKEIGANEATLRNMRNGEPYILLGRKGMRPGEAKEIVADKNSEIPTTEQVITFNTTLEGFYDAGTVSTDRVGPASAWAAFFNQTKTIEEADSEIFAFDVIGVTKEGAETILFENVVDGEIRLDEINAITYPYLRLRYRLENSASRFPEQLQQWQVNYTGVPEGVLVLKSKEEALNLQEGEDANVQFEFVNISNYNFTDSLTVQWSLQNKTNNTLENYSIKIPPIKAGESHAFDIDFNSLGKAGKNSLNVIANPREFLEQSYKNNVLDLANYITVLADDQNPVLDVNFDGTYIMDGDIVSPNVLVTALLKDENEALLKKDTTGVEVYLKRDCEGCTFQRVSFSNPALKWFEAAENSDFKLEYLPGPLEDGIYTLRINASDASGNQAGEKPYEVSFEVINESTITHFYPYPNPFSTSVRFVFTVTGMEPPDQVKVQIMTVTGKVVREILQDELGPIKIGHNISEYAWDGKDEFGDQLANGVYIYRVLIRKDGQFVEHRATAGDKAFKKGYGKMYLLR